MVPEMGVCFVASRNNKEANMAGIRLLRGKTVGDDVGGEKYRIQLSH